jgi:hypothetical protein
MKADEVKVEPFELPVTRKEVVEHEIPSGPATRVIRCDDVGFV